MELYQRLRRFVLGLELVEQEFVRVPFHDWGTKHCAYWFAIDKIPSLGISTFSNERWTVEDDLLLLKVISEDWPTKMKTRALGRTASAIRSRFKYLKDTKHISEFYTFNDDMHRVFVHTSDRFDNAEPIAKTEIVEIRKER